MTLIHEEFAPRAEVRHRRRVGSIQEAVDRLATRGGGRVEVSAGVFTMTDALHLRSGVTVVGQGADTVFRKAPMRQARIVTIIGYGHDDLLVGEPDLFRVGDGVLVSSKRAGGFLDTVGTLIRREGGAWFLNRAMNCDYSEQDAATVKTLHALVDAVDVGDAAIEAVTLDGNAAANDLLNGCRGGAFYAYRSRRVAARRVAARDFNGDGFSFQTCDDICFMANPPGQESNDHTFEACVLERNAAADGPAEILLQGGVRGTRLIGNRIARRPGIPGILVAPGTPAFAAEGNAIEPDGPDAVVRQT